MTSLHTRLRRRSIVATIIAALLSACATSNPVQVAAPQDPAVAEEARKQSDLAIRQEVAEFSRLQALFWPLTLAAAPLCPNRIAGSIGPAPGSLIGIRDANRPALRKLLGMEERLTFTELVEGTPAVKAGIQPGDVLIAVDGQAVPVSRDASKLYVDKLNQAAKRDAPVTFQLERKGTPLTLVVPVQKVCAVAAIPLAVDSVTAFAVGRGVLVTRGMMRFADDRELAIVMAHEIAHIALGHTHTKKQPDNKPSFDMQARTIPMPPSEPAPKPAPQQRELEADAVGLYLMAAAGLPIQDAANLWRRIAANYPATIQSSHLRTHPASPERFIELERTVKELGQVMASGQPLVARLKDGKYTAALVPVLPAGPWQVVTLTDRYASPLAPAVSVRAATGEPAVNTAAALR